ncbi:MAG: hypothetical protein RQ952_01125 [Thermoproteota archaeon]|jgi:hypothetical protein|nr:hypothetical protein [Thermoproteota archaeon]
MKYLLLVLIIAVLLIPISASFSDITNTTATTSTKQDLKFNALSLIPSFSFVNSKQFENAKQIAQYNTESTQQAGQLNLDFSFKGDSESNGYPPDVQIAVGPNHVVEMVNRKITIFDKNGNLLQQKTLYQFFNFPTSDNVGDPRIFFDIESQRFFAISSDFNAGIVKIAVSKTSDPTGDWYIYSLNDEQGRCTDYPILGLSSDKVAITSNIFDNCSISNPSYLWVRLWILDKNQLINGYSSLSIYTTTYSNYFSIYPAKSLGGTSTLYMVSTGSGDTSTVVYFVVDGNPSSNNVQISIYYLSVRYIASPLNAPQRGTLATINTDDARVLDATWYQNKLWFTTHERCIPQNDSTQRDCIRLISIATTTSSVASDNTIAIAQKYLFYPALSLDSNNNIVIVYGYSSSNDYASLNATAVLTSQTNSWLSPIQIKAGESYETRNRYGDYFGASVDPADRTKVWVAGEYMDGVNHWSTYIGKLSISSQPTPYVSMTLSYTVKSGSGYQPPIFSYYFNGIQNQATLTTTPTTYLVDKGSQWSVTEILGGSTQNMRWITNNQTKGIANEPITIRYVYYQQYKISFDYRISDNSNPSPPMVDYIAFGQSISAQLPTTIWADANTIWKVLNPLPNSNNKERWITKDDTQGIVNSSFNYQFFYFHQFYLTFSFNVIGGGNFVSPNASFYQFGSKVSKTMPFGDWLDANTQWEVINPLPNSNNKERWISNDQTKGTVSESITIKINYYHQFLINFNLHIVGGQNSNLPNMTYYSFGALTNKTMPSSEWIDANTVLKIPLLLKGSDENQRWITPKTSFTINSSMTLNFVYYLQYRISINYKVMNDSTQSLDITLQYLYLGNKTEAKLPFIGFIDANSYLNITKELSISNVERWATNNQTSIIVDSSKVLNIAYWRQFLINIKLDTIGGEGISPKVAYSKFGILTNSTLPLQDWADFNSTLRYDNIVYSGDKERWITFDVQSLIVNSSISKTIRYYHQYYVTIKAEPQEGGSVNLNSGWYNASSTINLQAVANEGWKFMYWSGAYNGNSSSISITVNGSITQIAVFYLSVTINNSENLIIEYKYDSKTGSIDQGSSVTLYLPKGTKLELNAKPSLFIYEFKRWAGSINVSDNPLKLQLEKPIVLKANSGINYLNIILLILVATLIIIISILFIFRRKR